MLLIIGGGMGFTVIRDLGLNGRRILSGEMGRFRLRVQTKIVLSVTAALVVAGTVVIFLLERNGLFRGYSTPQQLLLSLSRRFLRQ